MSNTYTIFGSGSRTNTYKQSSKDVAKTIQDNVKMLVDESKEKDQNITFLTNNNTKLYNENIQLKKNNDILINRVDDLTKECQQHVLSRSKKRGIEELLETENKKLKTNNLKLSTKITNLIKTIG
jgi:membrane-bound ClpP family serine protease